MELENFAIMTDRATKFFIDAFTAKLEDLMVGMSVNCVDAPAVAGPPPTLSVFATPLQGIAGTIEKIDGRNIVVERHQLDGRLGQQTIATDKHPKIGFATIASRTPTARASTKPERAGSRGPSTRHADTRVPAVGGCEVDENAHRQRTDEPAGVG